MSRIVTITVNPCIDINVSVPCLVPEKKLRCTLPQLHPGGGGINVARAIHRLGGEATALFFVAGGSGEQLERLLAEEGVDQLGFPVNGFTRENMMVVDESTHLQYRFIMPGPEVGSAEVDKMIGYVRKQEGISYLVVSGSMAPGMSADFFNRLAAVARSKGIRLVVDTSGPALEWALDAGVYMIKPSRDELIALAGSDTANLEIVARDLVLAGRCSVVALSLGAAGALLVTADKVKQVIPPAVKTVSTVGAGDSLVAGMVLAMSKGRGVEDAMEYGVACGTAATMHEGTSLCQREEVEMLYAAMKMPVPVLR